MNIPLLIVILYVLLLFGISIYVSYSQKKDSENFLLYKGKNNAFVVAASIAGLAIGGASTIGIAENAFTVGLSAGWYDTAWAIGAVVSSMLAVRYPRRSQYTTISGLVRDLYGTKTKIEEPKIEEFKVKKNVKSKRKTAQKLRALDASCRIVFVTTSPDFAVDSYDVNAAFYLLKPVTMERVSKALERCHLSAAEAEVSVLVPCQGTELRLPLHQISYTEYLKRRILVHMRDRSQHEISMNQRDFSALLLSYPWFCDCIKGVLVNLEDVDKLLEDRFLMKSGASIPISRLKYRDVREQYIQYSYHLVRGGPHL